MLKIKNVVLLIFIPFFVLGQTPARKEITTQTQAWIALNTTFKVSDHWGFMADAHARRTNFVADDSFYLLRGGVSYFPNHNLTLTLGYAHQWTAPAKPEWSTFSNENRIYQQVVLGSKLGQVAIMQRLRNEQRWQEKIANDERTGDLRFTDRVRYLLSFTIPIFKKKTLPSLVLSDEILIQFGKEVVYNTFDQNRVFIGIKQTITPKLSFDFGYMNVYQQKFSGYQYDENHTLRLFFYYNSSIKTKASLEHHNGGD
jgi:hypothetical protein